MLCAKPYKPTGYCKKVIKKYGKFCNTILNISKYKYC